MRKKKSDVPANSSAARKIKAAGPKAYVVIDYPVEGEIVTSPHYAFRIGAGGAERVEISFDGKQWSPCRESAGYWWYDWSGYEAGPRILRARLLAQGRPPLKSKPRHFTVLI
jgi:hypothetical protein